MFDWEYDNFRLHNFTNGKAIYWYENGQKKEEAV